MSDQSRALSAIEPPSSSDPDYDAICATVMATERGRRFLEEFFRRNHTTDTRVLLDAIGRIEGVVRGERARQADHALRSDLIEMAKAIAQTRAEVALDPAAGPAGTAGTMAPIDVFAAAERLKDVVWTMRERGVEFAACAQIDELATAILSASALRNPNDRRAQKLAEVLSYLEARIVSMLDACVDPPDAGEIAEGEVDALQAEIEQTDGEENPAPVDDAGLVDVVSLRAATELPRIVALPDSLDVEAELFGRSVEAPPCTMEMGNGVGEDAVVIGDAHATAPLLSPAQGAWPAVSRPGSIAQTQSHPGALAPLSDPLTALRSLSDEERIALFT